MASNWRYREGSLEQRFGLEDSPELKKYQNYPIWHSDRGHRSQPEPGQLTAIGLTSGIGSMLVGAQEVGFKVLGNIEWRDYYRFVNKKGDSSFVNNFPGSFMARGLKDFSKNRLPGQIDFAAGHPECGTYSALSYGVTNEAFLENKKSELSDIPLFLKMVAEIKPRFFLMDDLPDSFSVLPMSEYVNLLPEYDLFPEWVSNWGYGNIQKQRNRMFMVGALKSEKFTFVPGEEKHDLVLLDMIQDLYNKPAGSIANHQQVNVTEIACRYTHMDYRGQTMDWAELKKRKPSKQNLTYFAADGTEKHRPGTQTPMWNGYCNVLGGSYAHLHPLKMEPLNVRERARVQGFPDTFIFYNSDDPFHPIWSPYSTEGNRGVKQTGKAMPVQFCRYVAKQVKAHIEGKTFTTSRERVIKQNPKVSKAKEDFCRIQDYSDQEFACRNCWLKNNCKIREGKGIDL
jgi:site-specific DNA-cytosine methylase